MITDGLKSPNDLYLLAKNQNMSRYGGLFVIYIERYFVF